MTASEPPNVTFGSGAPIGSWSEYGGTGASEAGAVATGVAGASGAFSTAGSASSGSASSGSVVPKAGTGGVAGAAGERGAAGAAAGAGAGAGAAGSAAGSGGSSGAPTTNSVASLAFDVTTSAVGYRYQPKNIGAIWIQDQNGKLVKSLEVWARTRRRWLTRYQSQLAGSAVDVTASATLSNHRAHHVTWDLKDKSGATVAPGSYTLAMELTDGDQTGRMNTVPFDTSAGPKTLTPANAPSFNSMMLQLQ